MQTRKIIILNIHLWWFIIFIDVSKTLKKTLIIIENNEGEKSLRNISYSHCHLKLIKNSIEFISTKY
ncbi:hypothetical protein DERP_004796 [Dermatophagoides pteronyssinus]|uniref:Uncharacterized protein n=1 Tax=Dermatophagoides pteronyssinus TaxID=6956 RepID=A0ABQ8JSQ5_DERPT|nr:hypothetical protein DERP_004796 [Dermatophagoides pteronyssinus]